MSKASQEIQITKELDLLPCSCGRCCNAYKIKLLEEENRKLKFIIDNGLGPEDLKKDI